MICGACSSVPPAASLPSPARSILPLPAPIETQSTYAEILRGPPGTLHENDPIVIYSTGEHEKLMENIAELYRWIAEAMVQLDYYREEEK